MSTNLYDQAYVLEKAVRRSTEFSHLKQMFEAVANDPAARDLFDEFRNVQLQLQHKQMEGLHITDEEVMKAQEIANRVQQHHKVAKLMDAEQRMSMIIAELNKIILKPLDDLYGPSFG